MSAYTDLDIRMKEFYEFIPKTKLMRRTPVILRIDGKAFHSFTRGFKKPFDEILIKSMQDTMKYLCENIQGCVLGYTQSDEISLLLVDYKNLNSSAWFDYEVQKLCSISASMATLAFNKAFSKNVQNYYEANVDIIPLYTAEYKYSDEFDKDYFFNVLAKAEEKGAMFDARCFNIPKEEVANYFYWRQKDASKNSIQMLGRAYFSHKELHNKNGNDIQDMLMLEKSVNWNDLPTTQKRGSCCIKTDWTTECAKTTNTGEVITWNERPHWYIDYNIPIFKGEDRNYIERFVYISESDSYD